ncbi:MAG: helicase [Dehalococcoidia bacterium]|nr:helicase [Dehalococcoidia bacterium]
MPTHDIIDNRNEKLVDHINRILPSVERAKFAVGYFFLSGFEPIQKNLQEVSELKLLIGNTTNRETLEQISEGYKRLELVDQALEDIRLSKKADQRQRASETSENLQEAIALMDQTDEGEALVKTLVNLIEEKRLKVKVYTKGRLHAKAYIFDYKQLYDDKGTPVPPVSKGTAIVGSSNLTLAGISDNTELNVRIEGDSNHAELTRWFYELWDEAQDFEAHLMNELNQSWAARPAPPYDVYMKTLYTLVKDRLEEGEGVELLWDDEITGDLADFQKVAVYQAIQKMRDNGGCFVADVVGLGKSYIGAAILKHFERVEHARPLIICPKALEDMWEGYNETYHLNARVLPMSLLKETGEAGVNGLLQDVKYRDRNVVLVDESHNFRHHTTQRYEVLHTFLSTGRKCCFVTATPRNKAASDIYNQIKLFHQDDKTDLPIDPPDLKRYFKLIDAGERKLQDLLIHILVRRTRRHVLRWYGYAEDTHQPLREMSDIECRQYLDGSKRAYIMVGGKHQFFPRRELEPLRYSIEKTYSGLYQQIRQYLGRPRGEHYQPKPGQEISYARYGLYNYVLPEKRKEKPYSDLHRAGINLRGIIRVLLFKRFESSVYAFRETIRRLLRIHEEFLKSLDAGIVPAGDDAQQLLYESDHYEEADLIDRLREMSGRYDIKDFDGTRLREHIKADRNLLKHIFDDLVEPITPEKDAKLQRLLSRMKQEPLDNGKCLVFTQYADTAKYLYDNLNPGGRTPDVDVIYGADKSKSRMAGRFAPKANPEFSFQKGESEVRILVSTDVLSEGLNLQDCDKLINYDLHWNPVKLIQRVGRIDRIGSENDVVWAFNFLPETELDRGLGIKNVLQRRIQEIHDTIGEDAAILDDSEQLNEEAMYAIYEGQAGQLSLFEEDVKDFVDLNEAEEMLRNLKRENPEEFQRISDLRDGIRAAKGADFRGHYVFCQAGRFQQLFLTDSEGKIISRDISGCINTIKCSALEPARELPAGYNRNTMKIKHLFEEEVKHRRAERAQTLSLTQAQRYVLRELRILFEHADDETKARLNILERAFRMSPSPAVNKKLYFLRRNGVVGENLLKSLTDIYYEHSLHERLDPKAGFIDIEEIPRVICSEALT